ncbi:MAG: hypothetical protein OEZ65_10710 [Gemmatimonadota bacterium]|nr:hypothetical protein [Gemmatimonadota bacterium]
MHDHFALARDLRSWTVMGVQEALVETAGSLARSEGAWGLPPGSSEWTDTLRRAAGGAATAASVYDAAPAVAEVARLCGECHLAYQSGPGDRFQTTPPPRDGSAGRHMNYLAWSSRLLWDGLVAPSDRLWMAGARALAGAEGFPAPVSDRVPGEDVIEAGHRLRRLAADALEITNGDASAARAEILAEVWRTCAACHQASGISAEFSRPF